MYPFTAGSTGALCKRRVHEIFTVLLLSLFDTAMITTSWASNMTSTTPFMDDVTTHVITTATAASTINPVSRQTLQDDEVVTGASVPDYTIDWLDYLNRYIENRKKYRIQNQAWVLESQAHPSLVYTSAVVVVSVGMLGNGLLFLLAFREEIRSHSYRRHMAPGEGNHEKDTARKMSMALLSIPLFTLLSSIPYNVFAAYICISLYYVNPMDEKHKGFESSLMELEPYMQVFFTMGFAGNFWMLLITSSSYRSVTMKMLKRK